MKTKRLFIISLVILLFIVVTSLQADDDIANPDMGDHDGLTNLLFWYVDESTDILDVQPMPILEATNSESLIESHCSTEDTIPLPHIHWLHPLNSSRWGEIDKYWDARFWEGTKTHRLAGASYLNSKDL